MINKQKQPFHARNTFKNEILVNFIFPFESIICNCLQSKVFGLGINEGPLELKEIRPPGNSRLLFVTFMGSYIGKYKYELLQDYAEFVQPTSSLIINQKNVRLI